MPTNDTANLIAAAKAFRRAETLVEERRHALALEIGTSYLGGVRQADIVRITGYTREHVRRLIRERERQIEIAVAEKRESGEDVW